MVPTMKSLSHTQLFILKTLREGGKLITNSVSVKKLRVNKLLNAQNLLTNSGLEAIQEAEIKESKRIEKSF